MIWEVVDRHWYAGQVACKTFKVSCIASDFDIVDMCTGSYHTLFINFSK